MSGYSPLLGDLLKSNRRTYEKHLTEVKIKRTVITCCLCRAQSRLDTDERRSLKSVVCACTHPLCANCLIRFDVFTPMTGFRHRISPADRFRYSYGFYCDGCGASNKVAPQLQSHPSPADTPRRLRTIKDCIVDFTWRKCRWCEQRCHANCLLYCIKPWEHASEAVRSSKRNRNDYDSHARCVKARIAAGCPTSPLALYISTPEDINSGDTSCSSRQTTPRSLTAEEIETLEYVL